MSHHGSDNIVRLRIASKNSKRKFYLKAIKRADYCDILNYIQGI